MHLFLLAIIVAICGQAFNSEAKMATVSGREFFFHNYREMSLE